VASKFNTLISLPLAKYGKAPSDGALLRCSDFCDSAYKSGATCESFYKNIKTEGYFTCPYGFSCRSFLVKNEMHFFTGIAIKGHYDHGKLKRGNRLPGDIISEQFVDGAIHQLVTVQGVRADYNKFRKDVNVYSRVLHEVRNYNAALKAYAERAKSSDEISYLKRSVNSFFAISQMISSRLNYTNYLLNPAVARRRSISIYKKIDKSVRLYRVIAKSRNISINLNGSSQNEVNGYNFLEQLPAILIENAVKYSVDNTSIEVDINDDPEGVVFTVSNTGIFIHPEEQEKIFQNKYRGKEARASNISGTGQGLRFVKQVVNLHQGKIELRVGRKEEFGESKISSVEFKVFLPC